MRHLAVVVGVIAVRALASASASAETVHLAKVGVDVTLPSGPWQADIDTEGDATLDRIGSASASGAAVEIEAVNYGEEDGFGTSTGIGVGLGWTSGVDFDARGGVGLSYRAGPVALAAITGVGVDGIGTFEDGTEIHDAGLLGYIGGRARLAFGPVIAEGGVQVASRTAHDETRWEAALSWQPRHDTGYGLGVTSLSYTGLGDTTFVWLGVYPR